MRRTVPFLLMQAGMLVGAWHAYGMQYVNVDVYGAVMDVVCDTHFSSGVIVDVEQINIEKSLQIENYGSINGDIYLCDKCNVSIQNSGEINGRIHLGANADLVQVVQSRADMTSLDVDAPYTVFADGAQDLEWNSLYSMGRAAGTLVLRDTSLVFTSNAVGLMSRTHMPDIEMYGVITLNLPDGFVVNDAPVLQNISGDADIVITGAVPDILHAYVANVHDDALYLNLVRETDYYKILGNNYGLLLNIVRETMPSDPLLQRLDSAQDMATLENIMAHSIALNPILLMRPVRVLDSFIGGGLRMDMRSGDAAMDSRARPFYLSENDWYMYGATADFVLRPTGYAAFGVSVYGTMVQSKDEINAFSGQMFGGRITGLYDNDVFMARTTVGVTRADFQVPYVFDGDDIRTNVHGLAMYGVSDVGYRFGAFVPYIGADYHVSKILNQYDVDINARSGIEALFSVHGAELRYDYKLVAGANTSSTLYSGVGVGLVSPDDRLGGDMTINVRNDPHGVAWMLSVSARAMF